MLKVPVRSAGVNSPTQVEAGCNSLFAKLALRLAHGCTYNHAGCPIPFAGPGTVENLATERAEASGSY